ncbi:MAG: hypothetical protein GWN61_01460 [candidate division Zixibacteria bacterium]|nr:hypothetical protein [candidate division Zixibacteria bacterium]NIS44721.1 hypothetical protein [candidate division Zixibacteria bacterium]NIU12818.1 hypothetical protein [candidate division Zixibacteria bacterium]NIV04892.1 hypothetical protein [candidate division Zixibacteria bacterium]NIW43614.1 hypothetical protein [Gammaproteobacteria bacterium]
MIEYAGFDAPALREILRDQLPPPPEPVVIETPEPGTEVTFENVISPMLQSLCVSCHGDPGMVGLNLSSYETLMAGSNNGPVVIPGEPDNSLILQKLIADPPHFAQLSDSQLEYLRDWIANGAVEK